LIGNAVVDTDVASYIFKRKTRAAWYNQAPFLTQAETATGAWFAKTDCLHYGSRYCSRGVGITTRKPTKATLTSGAYLWRDDDLQSSPPSYHDPPRRTL
jgi:hypothetical protein